MENPGVSSVSYEYCVHIIVVVAREGNGRLNKLIILFSPPANS